MAKAGTGDRSRRITRDDLEQRFSGAAGRHQGQGRQPQADADHRRQRRRRMFVLIVFLLGKRSGKRKTTLVEIRRV